MFWGPPGSGSISQRYRMDQEPGSSLSYKKKYENNFFTSLKSLKKGVGSGVRFGSINLDPHQNVTDPPTMLLPLI